MSTHILNGDGEIVFASPALLEKFQEQQRLRASYESTSLVLEEFFKTHPQPEEIQF